MNDSKQQWSVVDEFLEGLFVPPDPSLSAVLAASDAAGLPPIAVTPLQGKLLMLLATACRANRILEIGTLGAYSTIWLARGLAEGGQVITIENERRHYDVAVSNIDAAGMRDRVDLRFGSALDVLPALCHEGVGPFDLIFIDADKRRYAEFFDASMPLTRRGTLIVADNVIRKGAVADSTDQDENVQGIQKFFDTVSRNSRVSTTTIQTVGSKGYDGWSFIVVTDPRA